MTSDTPAPASASRRPRFSTIVWGVAVLAFAVYMAIEAMAPGSLDPLIWLLGGVVLLGIALVVGGIVAAARRTG